MPKSNKPWLLRMTAVLLLLISILLGVLLMLYSQGNRDLEASLSARTATLTITARERDDALSLLANTTAQLETTTATLQTTMGERDDALSVLTDTIARLESTNATLTITASERDDALSLLADTTAQLETTTATLQTTAGERDDALSVLTDAIARLASTNATLTTTTRERDDALSALTDAIARLASTNATLTATTGERDDALSLLADTTAQLETTTATLQTTVRERDAAAADLEALESQVGDVETLEARLTELNMLIEERIPLIPQTVINGFACTGSMEPKITCLDEGRLLTNFDPDDIVVGTVINFNPTAANCDYGDNQMLHRVIAIDEDEGTFLPKGDNNDEDDGCWVHPQHIYSYLTALYKNTVPEKAPLRDSVNLAKTLYDEAKSLLDEADSEYDDYIDRYCSADYTCSSRRYPRALRLFEEWEEANDAYEQAVDYYYCWVDYAGTDPFYWSLPPSTCDLQYPLVAIRASELGLQPA